MFAQAFDSAVGAEASREGAWVMTVGQYLVTLKCFRHHRLVAVLNRTAEPHDEKHKSSEIVPWVLPLFDSVLYRGWSGVLDAIPGAQGHAASR